MPDGLLSGDWNLLAWGLLVPLLFHTLRHAPWRLLSSPALLNVWLGSIVLLAVIQGMKAGVKPGLSLHLSGAMLLTLCCGPRLAFLGLAAVLAVATANGSDGWLGLAWNILIRAGVGVMVCQAVFRLADRHLPRQPFIYIFANGFFGAAFSVLAVGLAFSLLFWAAGAYDAGYLFEEYLPYVLLLAFAEAWLSGMLVTLFVVYRPEWLCTFDDSRYLRGNNKN